jgi:uncharacterized protein YdeI (YjbR/CyaY-like superfamily)
VSAADYPRVHPKTIAQWRRWLRDHHASVPGAWFVTTRRGFASAAVPYADAVEAALCYGWIDGHYKPIDQERAMLLFTPRRAGRLWARSNRARVRSLIAAGRMRPAGLAKIEAAKRDGTFTLLHSAETGAVPADLKRALAAARLTTNFGALSMSAKRAHLVSLLTAKRPETRAKRVADIVRSLRP